MLNLMFGGAFEIMFFLVFGLMLTVFIVTFVKSISQWNKNNHSPKIAVEATVMSKRQNVSHHHSANHHTTTSTSYYVTFQVNTGDRIELHVNGYEYGMLAEGDFGTLTFQGTRYISFERQF